MTDQEITKALTSLLQDAQSPNSSATTFTSLNAVVQYLESKLGLNLSHKADFIRSQIQNLLFQPTPPFVPTPPLHHSQKDHFALPNYQPSPTITTTTTPTTASSSTFSSSTSPPPSNDTQKQSGGGSGGASGKGKRRGGPGGLNKLCGVSSELQPIVGNSALPRTEIVKQLWAYIRKNNLQDPNNKRKIICNDELRLVFETDCTDMFKMNKLLAKHIIPLEPTKHSAKKQKVDEGAGNRQPMPGPSVVISEALANLFGVNVREMLQPEVFTRVYEYINVNRLEDPMNPMVISCDAKLQELFGCQSLPASRLPEVLGHHIYRVS